MLKEPLISQWQQQQVLLKCLVLAWLLVVLQLLWQPPPLSCAAMLSGWVCTPTLGLAVAVPAAAGAV